MYESEYFFIVQPEGRPELPFLETDLGTSKRNFSFEALPPDEAPLRFLNGWRDKRLAQDIQAARRNWKRARRFNANSMQ